MPAPRWVPSPMAGSIRGMAGRSCRTRADHAGPRIFVRPRLCLDGAIVLFPEQLLGRVCACVACVFLRLEWLCDFIVLPKALGILLRHAKMLAGQGAVDFAAGEALAVASLAAACIPVRRVDCPGAGGVLNPWPASAIRNRCQGPLAEPGGHRVMASSQLPATTILTPTVDSRPRWCSSQGAGRWAGGDPRPCGDCTAAHPLTASKLLG